MDITWMVFLDKKYLVCRRVLTLPDNSTKEEVEKALENEMKRFHVEYTFEE